VRSNSFHRQNVQRLEGEFHKRELYACLLPPANRSSTVMNIRSQAPVVHLTSASQLQRALLATQSRCGLCEGKIILCGVMMKAGVLASISGLLIQENFDKRDKKKHRYPSHLDTFSR
jgi:hypothetical protein